MRRASAVGGALVALLLCGRLRSITTVAGTTWVVRVGGVPALNAPLAQANGIAFDSAGNIYVADVFDSIVVRVSIDGIRESLAGNGHGGFSGDGGPATSSSLNGPSSARDESQHPSGIAACQRSTPRVAARGAHRSPRFGRSVRTLLRSGSVKSSERISRVFGVRLGPQSRERRYAPA